MENIKCNFLDKQQNPMLFVKKFIKEHSDAIHILGGFRGYLSTNLAWRELQKRPDANFFHFGLRDLVLSIEMFLWC